MNNRNMKYSDFDEFKINESKILNSKSFSKYELQDKELCENNIFEIYSKYYFAIVLKSGKCYVYSNKKSRSKYWDIDHLEKNIGIELKNKSIIENNIGQTIKEQYEEMSNLTVIDVFMFKISKKDKKKE